MRVVEGNPIIEYAEHVVLPRLGELEIRRPEKYGGTLNVRESDELKKLYVAGELHPADLKSAVAEALIEIFTPVREYLGKG